MSENPERYRWADSKTDRRTTWLATPRFAVRASRSNLCPVRGGVFLELQRCVYTIRPLNGDRGRQCLEPFPGGTQKPVNMHHWRVHTADTTRTTTTTTTTTTHRWYMRTQ